MTQNLRPLKLETGKKYRLITKSDIDGIACAALLKAAGIIDEVTLSHPKDIRDGVVSVCKDCIIANLPYSPSAFATFDRNLSDAEILGLAPPPDNHISDETAQSATSVVFNYLKTDFKFSENLKTLKTAVNKAENANFSRLDVTDPQGWSLLSFIADSRTGLGRFKNFDISNYQLMLLLIDILADGVDIDTVLKNKDIIQRIDLYNDHHNLAAAQINDCCVQHNGNVIELNLLNEETIWSTNRFTPYIQFPKSKISVRVMWGRSRQNTVFAIGKNIFSKTSSINIGEICRKYGGDGHENSGSFQVDNSIAETTKQSLISLLTTA